MFSSLLNAAGVSPERDGLTPVFLEVGADPSIAPGVNAPPGSIAKFGSTYYLKTDTGVTNWAATPWNSSTTGVFTSVAINDASLLPDRRVFDVVIAGLRLFAVRTQGAPGPLPEVEIGNVIVTGGKYVIGNGSSFTFGTIGATTLNAVLAGGLQIGGTAGELLALWGATPGSQPAAVADATGAGDVVAQLNALLARLRSRGFIAT